MIPNFTFRDNDAKLWKDFKSLESNSSVTKAEKKELEATSGFEPLYKVLQTSA